MDLIRAVQEAVPGLYGFFFVVTSLGSEYAYIALLALYFWLVDPRFGRRLGLLVGFAFALNTALKGAFDTPRPFELDAGIATPEAQATAGGGAWPSGHAQGTATFWLAVAARHNRRWLWALAAAVVVLVALSRVYLGVHFLADVLGGVALGALTVLAGLRLPSLPDSPPARLAGAALAFGLALLSPELGRPLGVMAGFLLCEPRFSPPRGAARRLAFAGLGLLLVLALYLALGRVGPLRTAGWGDFARYLVLTLCAAELWPRLAARLTGTPARSSSAAKPASVGRP